jgi:serine/threonine protein kinase
MKTTLQYIGHYELRQRLGRSSSGEVWRAYDTHLQLPVILKFFRLDMLDALDSLTRYIDNARQITTLHHPNVVHVYDIQVITSPEPDSSTALVMLSLEDARRETLAHYIEHTAALGKTPPAADIVRLFSSLALAIDAVHQRGVIHGNLKPVAILLRPSSSAPDDIGVPMLTDFGATIWPPNGHGSGLPFYLAPEQIRGAPATERSDIYALGALLYELYTGAPPFRGNRPVAIMMQHINAQPTPPDLVNPGVSPALTPVILRCLAKDPMQRFPNAVSLVLALAGALHVDVPEEVHRSAIIAGETLPTAFNTKRPNAALRPHSGAAGRERKNMPLIAAAVIALILCIGMSLGSFLLATRMNAAETAQGSGQAFFINSGPLSESSTQGINDELEIALSNIPAPAAGKSYYAWLLGDSNQTEAIPILLGSLTVEHGAVHFLYRGDKQQSNLLAIASRFLITEDDAQKPSSDPLLNQGDWRYYAAIPQMPNPADALHFSLLDHLRHLLVESPELAARGLHGGLAYWFARNTAAVSDLAKGLAADWQQKDTNAIHTQAIRILDYLDGSSAVQADVPPGTPVLADTQSVRVALLGPAPQDASAPGYVYQDEAPPGYVYLIQAHLNGAVLSPQATAQQHQLAVQINASLDTVKLHLTAVYQDAKQIVTLTNSQLLQPSTLSLLVNMATQAQTASTGHANSASSAAPDSATGIYSSLQKLATFNVTPYNKP